ncbi:MAG: hypothetical protein VKI63_00140 [Cyanobium sp.]|nr:hypothetical protein [Cyanobium sp.]
MPRLNQQQILLQFFPDIFTTDNPEVMRRIGTWTCRLVLLDMLGSYENARAAKGPGAMVVRMVDGKRDADYLAVGDFDADLAIATRDNDQGACNFFRDVLAQIARLNHETHALFVMVEGQGASCIAVPFEAPEQAIAEMLKEIAP